MEDGACVVSNFICQSISKTPITIYGDGTQTRSFCYIDDLVIGLKKLMNSNSNILYPVNLGNPDEFTLLELVHEIEKISNKELTIEFQPLPMDDPKMRKPDIKKAQNDLGWKPSIKLSDGLINTYDYFLNELKK